MDSEQTPSAAPVDGMVMQRFSEPMDVDDFTVVFPANVIGTLIPQRDELPEEFRKHWTSNEWCKHASRLFFKGGEIGKFKKGIDAEKASRHLRAVLGSFEPQHEHKIGAAGFLMSLWLKECPAA